MKKQKVLDLRPTQFAVGMLEVDEKIKAVRLFSKKERKKFVSESVVPVVRGPGRELYVVDRHHYLCVCYHTGIEKVRVKVIADFSKRRMSFIAFWKLMAKQRNFYPFCQFGEGPRGALYLPRDIRGLADDPYRSLAWFVRKAGAFENSEKNFAEFQWANFFRSKKLLDRTGPSGLLAATQKAVKLAQSKEARHLPGYGKLGLDELKETITDAKRRIKKTEERDTEAT